MSDPLDLTPEEFAIWLQQHPQALNLEMVEEFKAEAEAVSGEGNLEQALLILDRAAAVATALQLPLAMGLVWRGRANVYQRHDHFEQSLAASQAAAALYQIHSTPFEVAKTRTVEIYTLGALGRFEEAIQLAAWIATSFENYPLGQAFLATNLAQVYTWAWRLTEAFEQHHKAYQLYQQLQRPDKAARVILNMGVTAEQLDQFDLAERYYQQAYPALVAANDPIVAAKVQYNLALLYLRQGKYEEALAVLQQVRASLAHIPGSPETAYVDLYEARVRRALHEPNEAQYLLRQAQQVFEQPGYLFELAETLIDLGHILAENDLADGVIQGLACLERAFTLLQGYPTPVLHAQVEVEQGEFLLRLDRPLEAIHKIESARRVFGGLNLSLRGAWSDTVLADCCWQVDPERAQSLYRQILGQAGNSVPLLGARAWQGLARIAERAKQWEAAEQAYRAAFELLQETGGSLHSHSHQAGFFERQQALIEGLLAVLQAQAGRESDILDWIERTRAQGLAMLIAQVPWDIHTQPELCTLLDQRQRLRDELDRRAALFLPGSTPAVSLQRSALTASYDEHQRQAQAQIHRQLQKVNEQIAHWQNTAVDWREAVSLRAHQAHLLLDDQTLYLAYYTVKNQLYALTASHIAGDVQLQRLPVCLSEIEAQWQHAARMLERADASKLTALNERLARLWQNLIAPIQTHLAGKQRLLISPQGSLFLIPFAALYDPIRQKYLVERYLLQTIPSLTVLDLCRKLPVANRPALLAGYSGEPDRPAYLQNVATEIRSLANSLPGSEILLDRQASLENVVAAMPGRSVVHLAGHACYYPRAPLDSGMLFADAHWLRASDLYLQHGRLKGAMVVLSGCEVGKGRPGGGEVLGLTSAFLYAGASSVVAGLWRVDDGATCQWMSEFYDQLQQQKDAVTALQQAQIKLRYQPPYSHPYYWAAFELIGDSRLLQLRV